MCESKNNCRKIGSPSKCCKNKIPTRPYRTIRSWHWFFVVLVTIIMQLLKTILLFFPLPHIIFRYMISPIFYFLWCFEFIWMYIYIYLYVMFHNLFVCLYRVQKCKILEILHKCTSHSAWLRMALIFVVLVITKWFFFFFIFALILY